MIHFAKTSMIIATLAVSCLADGAAGAGTTQPGSKATTTSQPASRPSVDPVAMRILAQQEEAGKKYVTIRAAMAYRIDRRMTGEREVRTGWVAYRRKAPKVPAKIRVHFSTFQQNRRRAIRAKVDYLFDGRKLIEAKHSVKQWQVYLAGPGEQVDALRLGKGPIPIPFGQKADDVLEHFIPQTRPPGVKDPKNTDYLKLITRSKHRKRMGLDYLEIWIDRKTHLPVKVVSNNKKDKIIKTVLFKNMVTDKKDSDGDFRMRRPSLWQKLPDKYLSGAGAIKP